MTVASRELALGVLAFTDTPAPRFVRASARAGFDSVSLRVGGSRAGVVADLTLHPELVDETCDVLDSTGTRVLDIEVLRLISDQAGRPTLEARAEEAAVLGARFGARHLIAVNQDLDPDACAHALARVCRVLEQGPAPDLQLCLEFMAFSATPNLAAAAEAVRRAEQPRVGVLVDTLHLARTRGRPADLPAYADVLAAYVQVCGVPSNPPASGDKRGLLAEATSARELPDHAPDLSQLLAVLPSDTAVSLEAPRAGDPERTPEARAEAGMRALRSALAVGAGV